MRGSTLLVLALALGGLVRSRRSSSIASKRIATPDERRQILAALSALGWPGPELDAAIRIESGWNARALHVGTRAAGLMQILPRQLPGLGWPGGPEAFAGLEPMQQLPYMRVWWARIGPRWRLPGDTYLAMAAPAFIGASDATVVYPTGSRAWEQNPLWRPPGGGDITAGSIRALLLGRM